VSTFVTATGTWRAKPPAAAGTEWTKSIIDLTQFYVNWSYSVGSVHANLRVSELYFDVDVRDQPVVTGITVADPTLTTRPTVSWQFNANADGDLQTNVQVKIFSAAQYGAGGFDPATSAATWDSGLVPTNNSTLVVGVDLLNGTTYKAYVAVAQDWNAGTFWWSTWGVSSAFTVNLLPPPMPSLVATPDPTVPNYRVLLDLTAPINLLGPDAASFETNLAQWAAETNCTISRVSTDAASGTWSMQMSSTASGDMSATSGVEPLLGLSVMAGVQYTALASFRAGSTGRACSVGIRWLNSAGATISTSMSSTVTDTNVGYTQAFITAVAPANAVSAMVRVNVAATGGAAELHRVDKVDIHVGTSQVWSVGGIYFSMQVNVERGERIVLGRSGTTPCAATASENWTHPQIATGGSVQRNTGYGFRVVGTTEQIPWEFLDVDLPGGSFTDGKLHWLLRAGTANTLLIGAWYYGGATESTWQFPAVTGQSHTFSFWAWVASGTLAMTPRIEWIADDAVTLTSTTTGGVVTLTTTPQRVSVTSVAPTGASAARGTLQNHTASASADVSLTRVGWGLGTVPVDDQPAIGGPIVWSPVRFVLAQQQAFQIFGASTGQRVLFADYEATPDRPLLYRARTSVTEVGQTVAGAYSPYVATYMPPPALTIVLDPLHPELCAVLNYSPDDSSSRSEDVQMFHPLNRDGDPVYVQDWISGDQGTLTLYTSLQSEIIKLQKIIANFTTVLIQWKTGGRLYCRVTTQSKVVRSSNANIWTIMLGYDEVARPAVVI
jgi:hypothetical protein